MDLSPLFISLKVATVATAITMLIGIPAAWWVAQLKRGKGIIDGILTLPMVLPPTVVGFFLLLIVGKNSFVGRFFGLLGFNITFTWIAAVIAAVVVTFPLMYRTARGAFEGIDINMIHAARTLGMKETSIFLKVVLPNTVAGMMAGIVLAFARALGEFGATMMIAGNIPGRTQTMSTAVYTAVQSGEREKALMWAIIITIFSLCAMIVLNRAQGKE